MGDPHAMVVCPAARISQAYNTSPNTAHHPPMSPLLKPHRCPCCWKPTDAPASGNSPTFRPKYFTSHHHQPARSDQIDQSQISDAPWQTPKGKAVTVNLRSEIGRFGLIVRVVGRLRRRRNLRASSPDHLETPSRASRPFSPGSTTSPPKCRRVGIVCRDRTAEPLSSEYGTHKTVKAT
jgi:hypothetical protein